MSKIKQLITFLIISNLLTLFFMAYSMVQQNLHQKRYLLDEIQSPLIQLQASIQNQKADKWKNPEIISFQVAKIQNAIDQVLQKRYFVNNKLAKKEESNLRQIERALQTFPQNNEYEIAEWQKADQQNALAFEKALKKAGLSSNVKVVEDYERFMQQCKIVAKESEKYLKRN